MLFFLTESTAGDLSASDNDDVSSLRCSSLVSKSIKVLLSLLFIDLILQQENKPLVKTKEKVEKKVIFSFVYMYCSVYPL